MPSLPYTVTALLTLSCSAAVSGYKLVHNFDSTNWYDDSSFQWMTADDPTQGFVDYTGLEEAQKLELTKITNNQVYLGVDSTNVVSEDARGRRSTWLTSQIEFKYGILIGDFAHMPASDCGTWPAFWTIAEGHDVPQGEDVPYGEFDIVEYANGDSNGAMTLHSPGQTCTFNQSQALQSSRRQGDASDCGADPGGCSTFGAEGSVGTPFNEQGGGVYAMDWTKQHINIFYFPRKEIPQDIADGNPDPKSWGKPVASFDEGDGDCDLDAVFYPQTIYFDTTFCGAMAGGEGWTDASTCAKTTGVATCEEYVRNNPKAFAEAYWLINSVKVYQ